MVNRQSALVSYTRFRNTTGIATDADLLPLVIRESAKRAAKRDSDGNLFAHGADSDHPIATEFLKGVFR